MDIQASKVFQATWYAKLVHVIRFTVIEAVLLTFMGAIQAFRDGDVGFITIIVLFILLFIAAIIMACTRRIIITPISVTIKTLFTEKSIPTPAIRRVRLEQGIPYSFITMRLLQIETSEGKIRMGMLSSEQIHEVAAYILELIRTKYPQNYEKVQQYSNNPNLLVEQSPNSAQKIEGGVGRVFEHKRTVKIVLFIPVLLLAVAMSVDTRSFLIFFLMISIAIPVILFLFKKFTITPHVVVIKSLLGSKSVPLGAIRVAKIQSSLYGGTYLLIKTDRSKYKMGKGIIGDQLNEALIYLLEQIRVNHPESYEMVRRSSSIENLWHK